MIAMLPLCGLIRSWDTLAFLFSTTPTIVQDPWTVHGPCTIEQLRGFTYREPPLSSGEFPVPVRNTTTDLMDAVKEAMGIESDYGLSKLLGINRTAVSN